MVDDTPSINLSNVRTTDDLIEAIERQGNWTREQIDGLRGRLDDYEQRLARNNPGGRRNLTGRVLLWGAGAAGVAGAVGVAVDYARDGDLDFGFLSGALDTLGAGAENLGEEGQQVAVAAQMEGVEAVLYNWGGFFADALGNNFLGQLFTKIANWAQGRLRGGDNPTFGYDENGNQIEITADEAAAPETTDPGNTPAPDSPSYTPDINAVEAALEEAGVTLTPEQREELAGDLESPAITDISVTTDFGRTHLGRGNFNEHSFSDAYSDAAEAAGHDDWNDVTFDEAVEVALTADPEMAEELGAVLDNPILREQMETMFQQEIDDHYFNSPIISGISEIFTTVHDAAANSTATPTEFIPRVANGLALN